MGRLKEWLKKIWRSLSPAYRTARRVEEQMESLRQQIDRHFERLDAMFWYSQAKPGVPLSETKREFFRAMPKAEGTLRTIQLGDSYLLRQFKRICEEEEIPYWLSFGTLLGAARHSGFIPWDDDIDVSVLRQGFEKLQAALEENKRFALRPFYDETGPHYIYKFVFRDCPDTFWVDITIWDEADTKAAGREETWRQLSQLRGETMRAVSKVSDRFEKRYHSEALSTEDSAALQEVFRRMLSRRPEAKQPDALYRSLDSVYLGGETLMAMEEIFPLRQLRFEGELYCVPQDYERYLTDVYRYLELPAEINPSHQSWHTPEKEEIERRVKALGLEEELRFMEQDS